LCHAPNPPHTSSRAPQRSATGLAHKDRAIMHPSPAMVGCPQDFSILLRFSLLFKRSTRLLCIFSSIFANRSRSSLVLIASTRRCITISFSTPRHVAQKRTCRSVSFSSFNSFSLALTAASAFLSTVRLSHDVWLARGRKAVLLSCHCLPGKEQISL
jgi:hypothetical protein